MIQNTWSKNTCLILCMLHKSKWSQITRTHNLFNQKVFWKLNNEHFTHLRNWNKVCALVLLYNTLSFLGPKFSQVLCAHFAEYGTAAILSLTNLKQVTKLQSNGNWSQQKDSDYCQWTFCQNFAMPKEGTVET